MLFVKCRVCFTSILITNFSFAHRLMPTVNTHIESALYHYGYVAIQILWSVRIGEKMWIVTNKTQYLLPTWISDEISFAYTRASLYLVNKYIMYPKPINSSLFSRRPIINYTGIYLQWCIAGWFICLSQQTRINKVLVGWFKVANIWESVISGWRLL